MANIFNPTVGQGIGFEQPVQTPSAIGAIGNIFGAFAQAQPKASEAGKPTADEKFAMAVREFEDAKGPTFEWSRNGIREFVFQYPQFTDQAKGFSEELQITTPMENAQEQFISNATEDWVKSTPEGAMAIVEATAIAEKEGEEAGQAFFQQAYVNHQKTLAELNKIERDKTKFANDEAVDAAKWNAIAGPRKDYVDSVVRTTLAPLVEDVKNGKTVAIPPDVQAALGVDYNTVNMSNLKAVLVDAQSYLERENRNAFGDPNKLPTTEWNDKVMSSFKSILDVADSFDTPQEQANAVGALIELQVTKQLDEAGLATTAYILKNYDPAVTQRLLTSDSTLTAFAKVMAPDGKQVLGIGEIKSNIANGSVADAKEIANDTMTILFANNGFTRESFSMFTEAQKRSGYGVIDSSSFSTMISDNVGGIKELVNTYPDFAQEFGDWLYSDIEQTRILVERDLGENFTVSMQNGKFTVGLSVKGKTHLNNYNQTALRQESEQEFIDRAINRPSWSKTGETGLSLKDLNTKMNTLNYLGEAGKTVRGAFEEQTNARGNVLDQLTDVQDTKASAKPTRRGEDVGVAPFSGSTVDMIKEFEGFSTTAYWDVNAFRAGYGSDTVTLADGTVKKVTKDTLVTRADAERDLARRTQEFSNTAANNVGADTWTKLPENIKSALTSIAYNYGNIPSRIRGAIQTLDPETIATAVEGLAGDNDGVNRKRRMREADTIRAGVTTPSPRPEDIPDMISGRPALRPSDLTATENAPTASVRPLENPQVGVPQGTVTKATEGSPALSEEVIQMLKANPDQALQALIEALNDAPEDKKKGIAKRFEEIFR